MNPNPYLSGNFAPVTEEVTAFDLDVTGQIPVELNGRYLRNGPNPRAADPARYHWFLGDGMIHGLRLRDGRAEWYRNRWVTEQQGTSPNTNVIGLNGQTLALVEAGSPPVELGYELERMDVCQFTGGQLNGYSAHPKVDPVSGDLHAASYNWSVPNVIEYSVVGSHGSVDRRELIPVPGSPMVHDISLTQNYAVFYDLPVVFNLEDAAAGAGFPYAWSNEYGARIGLLPLGGVGTDELRWFEVDPCYVFHALNSYEAVGLQGQQLVVLDVVRHDRVFDRSRRGPDESVPSLWRWELDLDSGKVTEEQLSDEAVEFPRIDERLVGRQHRYGWLASTPGHTGADSGPGFEFDGASIACFDFEQNSMICHEMGPGRAAGEAVFVPAASGAGELEGYVMSLVYDASTDRSDLVILAAQDLSADPVATVHLPQRVPFGFHGNFVAE
ncbi:MAG: carotenoid oxygenase family protein [Microthrixaceae bacterium]